MKALNEIIEKHHRKVGFYQIYNEPQTISNGWIGNIYNCIAYIELLGLISTSDVKNDIKRLGYNTRIVGLDIYITK